MSEITYSVIGPGSSGGNKITGNIGCENGGNICWVGRTRYQDDETCTDSYRDETYCKYVPAGDSSTPWNPTETVSIPVFYNLTKYCPQPPSPSCTFKCSNGSLTAYPVPAFVPEDYAGDIDIHYTYTRVCESGEYVGGVETINGVETVPFSSFIEGKHPLTKEGCSVEVIVGNKEGDDCTPGERADISISFDPKVVPSTGASVNVIVSFKRTITDDNCNKKITSGSFSLLWEVKCEGTEEKPYKCCEDHYVTSSITKTKIIEGAKLGSDVKIYYDSNLVTEDNIEYKILQKAKITDECENYCHPGTTYGVKKNTVKVYYETEYMSDVWVNDEGSRSEGDCKDCSSLSIYPLPLNVPYTGGRIKVTWDYVAHTVNNDCSGFYTEGTWEEIIPIGGCDERPKNCTYDLVFNDGTTCPKTENSRCDAECCYDYDGNGNSKCVIYFKEQFPEFYKQEDICAGDDKKSKLAVYKCTKCGAITSTKSDNCTPAPPKDKEGHEFCPSCHSTGDDVFGDAIAFDMSNGQPDGEGGLIYNKVTYEFLQDCTPVCEEEKSYKYGQKKVEISAEAGKECEPYEYSSTITDIPYTATTEYIGYGCPGPTTEAGVTSYTLSITASPNYTKGDSTVFENEMVKVVRKDKCEKDDCDCESLEYSEIPEECVCENLTYEPVGCNCNVYGDIAIPASLTDLMVVGAYTSTGCSTTETGVTFVSGVNFLGEFELINSDIRAKVISENPSTTDPRTGTYKIKIGECEKNLTFTQNADIKVCTCDNISAITEIKDTIFDNAGCTEQQFVVYLTKGCGSVSATSNSIMFDGDIKAYSYDKDGVKYDDYQENAFFYSVNGALKMNTGADRSGGVSIHLKKNDSEVWGECEQAKFYIQQRSVIYKCSDVIFEGGETEKSEEVVATEDAAYSQELSSITTDYAVKYEFTNGAEYADTGGTYMHRSGTRDYCVVKLQPNTSTSPRTIEVSLCPYVNVDFVKTVTSSYRNDDWVGGKKCPVCGTFTITQDAKVVCNCSSIDASKAKIGDISGYEYPDNTFTIDSPLAGTNYITIIIDKECTSFDGVEPIITSNNTDFIPNESIKIIEYVSGYHRWKASFDYTQNSSSQRTATLTITFCEGKSFTATVKQVGGGCVNCKDDFEKKVTVDTSVSGRCYGVSSEIIKHTSMCGVEVEVQGVTQDWLKGFRESTLSGVISITPLIKPNYNTSPRSFVYKVKAKNLTGCELESSYTYYQEGYKPCNKDNYLSEFIGITDERGGTAKDVGENSTITAGTVTITVDKVLLDCVKIVLSTSQSEYIDESSLIYENVETGLDRDYKYYMKFDVVCTTKSIGSAPSQAVTVDVNTFINGEDMHKLCQLNLVIKKP